MASGEPCGVQIAAYFFALARGRIRRMMPWRIGHHSSARQLDHARIAQQSGEESAHVARGERRRRAGIDQQHAPLHADS